VQASATLPEQSTAVSNRNETLTSLFLLFLFGPLPTHTRLSLTAFVHEQAAVVSELPAATGLHCREHSREMAGLCIAVGNCVQVKIKALAIGMF
jgi:hypothetical protein